MIPLVSVIVPCYNQAQFLDECLQSVLNQTYTIWECIIVNDGSQDNTEKKAQVWTSKDSRFNYISIANAGVSNARNVAIQSAKGEFILPLDADDKIAEEYIKLAMQSFKDDATLKLVYCKAQKFGVKNEVWKLPDYSIKELAKYNIIFCSAIYRKVDWKSLGGYDIKMIQGLEDWDFWIALLKNGGKVKCLDYMGFYYRINEISRQQKVDSDKIQREILMDYVSIKHADFFVAQYGNIISLNEKIINNDHLLKSKKFALNLFLKNFFRINLFKN